MTSDIARNPFERGIPVNRLSRLSARFCGIALGMTLGSVLSAPALAGGVNVSTDEIYADGLILTTIDGLPLDINGDGHMDLAVATNRNVPEERSRYYLGNGDGTFSGSVLLAAGAASEILAADLNNDTFIDLLGGRRDATALLYLADGAGSVGAGIDLHGDTNRVLALAIGDLDNDGDLDVVAGTGHPGGVGPVLQRNRFYLNDTIPSATLTFTGADISADEDDTRSIALADMNGDGTLDIIVGNDETTAGSNLIYLNLFVSGVTPVSFAPGEGFGPPDDQTSSILIGDLDGDGRPDIVVLNHVSLPGSPGINRFFLNESAGGVLAIGPAMDVSGDTDDTAGGVLADFDGDGDLDLAVANLTASGPGQSSRNRLYLNQFVETGTVSFAPALDISADEQHSRDMAAADLNGDGHIDLIVGNQDDVPGVPGHERRYLNNGTADPFTNVVPVISGQAALATDEQTPLAIGLGDVTVDDPDNVFPSDFTLTVAAGANYSVDNNTITPEAGFTGALAVSVTVNDGTDESDAFDLTVTVGDPPVNAPPAFTSTPVLEAVEASAYVYEVTASDADSQDVLAITAPALPAWMTLTDNGDGTATLTGTPAASDAGDHSVSLQVTDGSDSALQEFTVSVEALSVEPPQTFPPPRFGGGGSVGFLSLLMLCAVGASRRFRRNGQ